MSRHSKWSKIKRAKGAADVKKGAVFTKLGRAIAIAAREKGADMSTNFKLRLAVDAAKAASMPKENIERAIARASGKEEAGELFEVTYEGIGPGGVAIMIDAVTDNKNRTSGNVKNILAKHGGAMAGANAVAWQFERKGIVIARSEATCGERSESTKQSREDKERMILELIEVGADDIKEEEGGITVVTPFEKLQTVSEFLVSKNISLEHSGLTWISKNPVTVTSPEDRAKLDELYEALDEDDDVVDVATNEI